MIKTKKELKDCLKYEKDNYGNIPHFWRLKSFLGVSEKSIIWKYQTLLRKWEYYQNNSKKVRIFVYKFLATRLGRKYGLSIAPNCFEIGLRIMHLGSIIVNSESRVGPNCTIHVNTALVATGGTSDSPKIGNNCKIGIGSTIVGGVHLGNNVVVGAGAVVVRSFDEDHITLGGVPAKIISHKAVL